MNRRLRFAAALVTLLAFSAYFAESVWAATCPPDMHGGAVPSERVDEPQHHGGSGHSSGAMASRAGAGNATSPSPDEARGHGDCCPEDGLAADVEQPDALPPGSDDTHPACPFAAVGASGCVSVSMAAPGTSLQAGAAEDVLRLAGTSLLHDVLLASNLFHPPRS